MISPCMKLDLFGLLTGFNTYLAEDLSQLNIAERTDNTVLKNMKQKGTVI